MENENHSFTSTKKNIDLEQKMKAPVRLIAKTRKNPKNLNPF
jgi:hypothetical protein